MRIRVDVARVWPVEPTGALTAKKVELEGVGCDMRMRGGESEVALWGGGLPTQRGKGEFGGNWSTRMMILAVLAEELERRAGMRRDDWMTERPDDSIHVLDVHFDAW